MLDTHDKPVEPAEALPSATVILLRTDTPKPQVLLLKRNTELKVMPGAWIFPGGKVEAEEMTAGPVAGSRRAAVRELEEEAGIQLDGAQLHPFSHWLTPVEVKRRFATWFYLAIVESPPSIVVDGSEIVDYLWISPSDALAEFAEGRLVMPPPTLVTLEDLKAYASTETLRAGIASREPPYYFPKLCKHDGGMVFLYPGDSGYENQDPSLGPTLHRSALHGKRFSYQRSFEWPPRGSDTPSESGL